jgi:hypothetical protein
MFPTSPEPKLSEMFHCPLLMMHSFADRASQGSNRASAAAVVVVVALTAVAVTTAATSTKYSRP